MPIDLIGGALGIITEVVGAPRRAEEARMERERLVHEQRMAALAAERQQAQMRTVVIIGGVGVAGVVAFMALK